MGTQQQRKLCYRFHDPNPPGVAAEYILQVLIESSAGKAEAAIRAEAETPPGDAAQKEQPA